VTIRAVLFDAGNTLMFLEYDRLATEVGAALGITINADDLRRAAPAAARTVESGTSECGRDRASRYLESLFMKAGVLASRLEELRTALLGMHSVRHLWSGVDAATSAAIDRIRAMGIATGVVSNSDGRVAKALQAVGLLERFDVVIDSSVVGVEKPDAAIFTPALRELGVTADETVYLGDIYDVDVVGARAAGIEPILIGEGDRTACGVAVYASVAKALVALEATGRLAQADEGAPAPGTNS
jgi:putative hydrolase of the HAD superfamily